MGELWHMKTPDILMKPSLFALSRRYVAGKLQSEGSSSILEPLYLAFVGYPKLVEYCLCWKFSQEHFSQLCYLRHARTVEH